LENDAQPHDTNTATSIGINSNHLNTSFTTSDQHPSLPQAHHLPTTLSFTSPTMQHHSTRASKQ
jgi:hypothetical protein